MENKIHTEEEAESIICSWIDAGICYDAQDMDEWKWELMNGVRR